MNLKHLIQSVSALVVTIFIAAGCSSSPHEADAHHEEHADEGVTFSESKGLSVPKSTADFIGLKIVDVGEQQLASTLKFSVKVYRPSAPAKENAEARPALATGLVRKTEAAQLQNGQKIKLQTENGETYEGKILSLNHEMEKANGQVEVLVEIDDAKQSLPLGSGAEVVVATGKEETVVGVPKTALLRTAEGNFVYTVSGEHLVRSEVKVGQTSSDLIEIKDGLYAGDQIVANPVMTLWMAELQAIRGGAACADGH